MNILAPFMRKKSEDTTSEVFHASRRDFLKSTGLLAGGLALGVSFFSCDNKGNKGNVIAPNVYLTIDASGQVTIIAHRSEMGQGIRTSLPMVVADELGADWSKVKIVQAEGDEEKYGDQNTDGSYSMRMFFKPMREAGAIARLMLMRAAAEQWKVDVKTCDTENGEVIHRDSGKKIGFGDLVEAAQKQAIPKVEEITLKDRKDLKMVGKKTPIIDLHDIVTGKAVFGIDAKVDGLKVAVIKRCPVVGGSVKSFNDEKARAIPGVVDVIQLAGAGLPPTLSRPLAGVAVIADNTWAAIKGRDALEVEWDLGPNANYDSEAHIAQLKQDLQNKGTVRRQRGDVASAVQGAKKVIDHTYVAPYLAHGTMEPPTALAVVKDGKCEIWACTQNPQGARDAVAQEIGFSTDDVRVNVTLIGGGFGRKSKPDFILEAALLAKETGLPIRVQWTREDDIQHDYYHAMSVQRIVATIDNSNNLSSWNHHIAYPSISATMDNSILQPADGELGQGATDYPYEVPNIQVETHDAAEHIRIGWLRSVRNIPQAFAIATMMDEIAEARGKDPIEQALELLGADRNLTFEQELNGGKYENYGEDMSKYPWEVSRMKRVIERVKEESGWGKQALPKGSALGFAVHRSFLTYVACVVKVQVNANKEVSIPEVHYAVDCGTGVNVDRVISQFEGGAQFSSSFALKSKITVKNGQIEQSNFDGYQLIRMKEAPKNIKVYLVEDGTKPTGVGEPPVPPFTPALCNAIYAATGKRIYELPIDLKA